MKRGGEATGIPVPDVVVDGEVLRRSIHRTSWLPPGGC